MFIPRNQRIAAAIADAEAGRFAKFHDQVSLLARPYEDQPEFTDYANPRGLRKKQTFCGT